MLGDGCCWLKSRFSPWTLVVHMPFFMSIVTMWHILFFLFDYHSELSPTHPQSDMCDSPSQSAQYYSLFSLSFVSDLYVCSRAQKEGFL